MIRKSVFLLLLLMSFAPALAAQRVRTMRLDYFHTGNAKREVFSFDRVVLEPRDWSGTRTQYTDDTNLGKYMFEVRDRVSGRVLFSRGFSSIYGEWETTEEAAKTDRTFSESLRFPAPEAAARIVVKKRDAQNAFQQVWSYDVDPNDKFIERVDWPSPSDAIELQRSGPPETKADLLILGDGYTAAERPKFEKDARRLIEILFSTSPFKEHHADFNVWGLCPPAQASGISRPSSGVWRNNPIGSTYDAFGSERYVLTFDNRAFREVAQFVPYDFVEILVNGETYGGGGIFGLYSTVASDSTWAPYVFVHEFGHHFAALADEYYTSEVAYQPATKKIEPWEPNVTALLDPSHLKWHDLVDPSTPLPTPWNKTAFEEYERQVQAQRKRIRAESRPESEMDALFREEEKHEVDEFAREKYAGKVGAFEGANYEARGYYRPELNCIMFTRHMQFCRVCRRAIERIIAMYTAG